MHGCIWLIRIGLLTFTSLAFAGTPDWTRSSKIPQGGRPDPFRVRAEKGDREWTASVREGRFSALHYPVEITGLLAPIKPLNRLLESPTQNPFKEAFREALDRFTGIDSLDSIFKWLGLASYPTQEGSGAYFIPFSIGPNSRAPVARPNYRMGFTQIGEGFTVSCAGCHAGTLFGREILGMTNRFPRANELFVRGRQGSLATPPLLFQAVSGATPSETRLFDRMRRNLKSIEPKLPTQLGLDTSLAHVALSLSRRSQDPWAEKSALYSRLPRPERLRHFDAEAKPAVWWNLKYKNRWLSDGSIVSGNPIITNILWNEIGRGLDLHELDAWLKKNHAKLEALTTAVFAAEAPRFKDFFPNQLPAIQSAMRGESLFEAKCSRCHGHYDKDWTGADPGVTTQVRYHAMTPVIDVGTDPSRYEGMQSLAKALNPLQISKNYGIEIVPQKGYVPPPLVGIWARYPYFHNNSAPSLCAVLSHPSDRPVVYYAGPQDDPTRDFDFECNGYPVATSTPKAWLKNPEFRYDTRKPGHSNSGHDEDFSPHDRQDLIHFLQTL